MNRGEVSFYRHMSKCAKCFYDSKGDKRSKPIYDLFDTLVGSEIGSEMLNILEQMVDFAMNKESGIFSPYTKLFYVEGLNQTQFAQAHDLGFNTFNSRLRRDKDAFIKLFGEDALPDMMGITGAIIFAGRATNISKLYYYKSKLLMAGHNEEKLFRFIKVPLGDETDKCEPKEFTDCEWEEGYKLLMSVTPIGVQRTADMLTGKVDVSANTSEEVNLTGFIGYVNYLMNTPSNILQEVDADRKTKLDTLVHLNEWLRNN